jgi:protein lysine acetyltransferase
LTVINADELAGLEIFAGIDPADLATLAEELKPLRAFAGEVLMRQGDRALSFLLIAEGSAKAIHSGADGETAVAHVAPGLIVGEIALLRDAPRSATVIAADDLYGFVGHARAFSTMLEIPGIADKLVRTARQRLAAYVPPVPVEARDGTALMLRPVLPGDGERVIKGRVWFSPETVYRRFLSVRTPNDTLLTYLSEVDYVDHFVWVVIDAADRSVVADGRYVRSADDQASAEIAFTVADAYQGRGIGTLLLAAVSVAARVDGILRFHAEVLAENWPARTLMDRLNAEWVRGEQGLVTTTVNVPAPQDIPAGLSDDQLHRIEEMARQVIHAFD